jgi:hypothetical protein
MPPRISANISKNRLDLWFLAKAKIVVIFLPMFDADKQHKKITPSKSKTHAVVETFSPR